MEIHEIVMKLVGPVDAVGESNADERRLANMNVLIDTVDRLLFFIGEQRKNAERVESSMKQIGMRACRFFDDLSECD